MTESRWQGLCYYCDDKYSPGHKCKELKLFHIDATKHGSNDEALPSDMFGEDEVEP